MDAATELEETGVGQLQQAGGKGRVAADELGNFAKISLRAIQLYQQQRHHSRDAGHIEGQLQQFLDFHTLKSKGLLHARCSM